MSTAHIICFLTVCGIVLHRLFILRGKGGQEYPHWIMYLSGASGCRETASQPVLTASFTARRHDGKHASRFSDKRHYYVRRHVEKHYLGIGILPDVTYGAVHHT